MIAILPIPGSLKAATGLIEGIAGLGSAPTRIVERLRQIGNLGRATSLQALIDRPRVTAGFRDQRRNAYVAELHRTAHRFAAPRSSMSVNTNIAAPPRAVITLLPRIGEHRHAKRGRNGAAASAAARPAARLCTPCSAAGPTTRRPYGESRSGA